MGVVHEVYNKLGCFLWYCLDLTVVLVVRGSVG